MQQGSVDVMGFLTVMSALSGGVQTLVGNVIKKHVPWLDEQKAGWPERFRFGAIHLLLFLLGGALALTTGLEPLTYLRLAGTSLGNAATAGVLVSFGGSVFNEALGAVRAFKKQQESMKETIDVTRAADRRKFGIPEPVHH